MRGTDKVTRMVGLRAGEVSLVKSPAVPDAKFVIVKEELVDGNGVDDLVVHTKEIDKETDKLLGEFVSIKAYDRFTRNILDLFEKMDARNENLITLAISKAIAATSAIVSPTDAVLEKAAGAAGDPAKPPVEAADEETEGEEAEETTEEAEAKKTACDQEHMGKAEGLAEMTVDILLEAAALLRSSQENAALKSLDEQVSRAAGLVQKLEDEKLNLQRSLRKALGKDPDGDSE